MKCKQLSIRLNKENLEFVTELKDKSLIENLSLNQVLNTIITEKRKERNLEKQGSEEPQLLGNIES